MIDKAESRRELCDDNYEWKGVRLQLEQCLCDCEIHDSNRKRRRAQTEHSVIMEVRWMIQFIPADGEAGSIRRIHPRDLAIVPYRRLVRR